MKNRPTNKNQLRARRHARVRAKIVGTATRPRLAVYLSNRFVSAQLIDDAQGITLASAHGREVGGTQSAQAQGVGNEIAKRAKEKGIAAVVFDRGGYRYAARVKALADAARAGGLTF